VDEVTRDMVIHNVENLVVVEGHGLSKPIGVARAADILCACGAGSLKKKDSGINRSAPRPPHLLPPERKPHPPAVASLESFPRKRQSTTFTEPCVAKARVRVRQCFDFAQAPGPAEGRVRPQRW
jgi:hypothetical protein